MRGRTYAIPFSAVWNAVRRTAARMGWAIVVADEQDGRLRAEARTTVFRFVDDVEVRVTLDTDAQTRVDMQSESRIGSGDLGTNRRRIGRFMRRLDRELGR